VQQVAEQAAHRPRRNHLFVDGVFRPVRVAAVEEPQRPIWIPLAVAQPAVHEAVAARKLVGGKARRGELVPDALAQLVADPFIGVERQDPVVPGVGGGEALLCPITQPFLVNYARAVSLGNSDGIVGTARVHHDKLIGKGNARETSVKLACGVAGNNHRGQRFGHDGILCENSRMSRVLLIKTSSLGDVVHNLPVVADIHANAPDARIEWVVEEGFADIPRLHPGVSRVIPVALRRWRRRLWSPAAWREMRVLRQTLGRDHYDLIIDTQGLIKSALLARLAQGTRCGQDAASAREPLCARFYDRTYPVARGQHAVARNRELVAHAIGYAPPTAAPDYGIDAPREYTVPDLTGNFVVCLHATSRTSKLWPESHWIRLGAALRAAGLAMVLPWGNVVERTRAQAIASRVEGARVLPRLAIRDLAAVMGHARAAVGVDTGLVHLAVALGLPTVAIYTDTSPLLTGVYPANSARAVNLGNAGEVPAVEQVRAALDGMI
jgi:heptosyltransferase-1